MTPRLVLLSTIFALSLAVGQILFKQAAAAWSAAAARPGASAVTAILSPWLFVAGAVYGATALLWIYILRSAPLSKAYIFSVAGSALVPLAAWLIFREPLDARYWIGFALMLTGVFLCAR